MPFRFLNEDGSPVTFSVESLNSEYLRDHLAKLIQDWGGSTVQQSSAADFYLVDPRTPHGHDALASTSNAICYTFVRACIEGARRLLNAAEIGQLWPILVQPNGEPLRVFFHPNISSKASLRMKTTQCGGMRWDNVSDCHIILVEREANEDGVDEYNALRKRHAIDPNVRVQLPSWIDECMLARQLVLDPKPVRRLPGTRLGSRAIPFTEADDKHLIRYLATKVPYKGTKGRAGDAVYKSLCDPDNEAIYPWASSHTWNSWSNRYRKNQEYFDRNISRYLESHPEIIRQWNPAQSYSKKAARKLGLSTAANIAFHSDSDDGELRDESEPDDVPTDFGEVDQQALDDDRSAGAEPVMRSPGHVQASPPRRTTTRSQQQAMHDYSDFPEIKEGDDSAAPQWSRKPRLRVEEVDPKLRKPSKGKPAHQHLRSRSKNQPERNDKNSEQSNEPKGQTGAATTKNKARRWEKVDVVLTPSPTQRKRVRAESPVPSSSSDDDPPRPEELLPISRRTRSQAKQ